MLQHHAFLYDAPKQEPFTGSAFQRLVAQIHGVNCEIRAPVIAFIAYKLSQLLGDDSWNVVGQKVDDDADDSFSRGYLEFLDLAIAYRGKTITPVDGHTWIRIAYDVAVRVIIDLA